MTDKTPAMPELPEPELRAIYQRHELAAAGLVMSDFKRIASEIIAALQSQAQPATLVSVAGITQVIDEHSTPLGIARHDLPSFARSILALQSAQPAAAVSDAEIVQAAVCSGAELHCRTLIVNGKDAHDFILRFARAILALRPQAVPMTEQWRLLRSGERIEASDEGLQDDCVTWLPLSGWEVGMTYNPHVLVPMRRRAEAHHGITQRADGGEVARG